MPIETLVQTLSQSSPLVDHAKLGTLVRTCPRGGSRNRLFTSSLHSVHNLFLSIPLPAVNQKMEQKKNIGSPAEREDALQSLRDALLQSHNPGANAHSAPFLGIRGPAKSLSGNRNLDILRLPGQARWASTSDATSSASANTPKPRMMWSVRLPPIGTGRCDPKHRTDATDMAAYARTDIDGSIGET